MEAAKTTNQNIAFSDAKLGEKQEINGRPDSSFYNAYNAGTELSDFLQRPVLINSNTWNEGSLIDYSFNPWFDYFNDERIKKKLDNYAFLACNLKLKVMINASPFYYGMAMMSYNPLSRFNGGSLSNEIGFRQKFVPLSQRPNIKIFPQTNQGGEMTLPYFNYKDWLNITSAQDLIDFGEINILSITQLANANSVAGQGVSIQVYAWAEDVKVCGNTLFLALQSSDVSVEDQTEIEDNQDEEVVPLSPEGDNEEEFSFVLQAEDEYDKPDGFISAPASAIAKASAGLAFAMPEIAPYALASSFVFEGISSIASYFGYSNTANLEASVPMMPKPYRGFCSPELSTPVEKLTIDPKNEISIDTRLQGLDGCDEMVISNIVQRESFLFDAQWDQSDPVDHQILASKVRPSLLQRLILPTGSSVYQQIPVGHVSDMFKYWRGDMIFKFHFICSQYHRGRVRITWDPVGNPTGDPLSSTVAYTKIVDITEEPVYELRIPYQQAQAYLETTHNIDDFSFTAGEDVLTPSRSFDNGLLSMRVFTESTSPVADAPIQVIVTVRGAENIEFAAPRELDQDRHIYQLQSDDVVETTEVNEFFPTKNDHKINLVYMGESITSVRQLLRRKTFTRYQLYDLVPPTNTNVIVSSRFSRLPLFSGFDPNGINLAISPIDGLEKRYNFVKNTPFTHMRNCYIGNRGTMDWLVHPAASVDVNMICTRRSDKALNLDDYNRIDQYAIPGESEGADINRMITNDAWSTGATGMEITSQKNMAGTNSRFPMYSAYRMLPNDPATAAFGDDLVDTNTDGAQYDFNFNERGATTLVRITSLFASSIGEDFNFIYFLNVPSFYRYNSPTPADTQPRLVTPVV